MSPDYFVTDVSDRSHRLNKHGGSRRVRTNAMLGGKLM